MFSSRNWFRALVVVSLSWIVACSETYEEVVINSDDDQAVMRVQNSQNLSNARVARLNTLVSRALPGKDFEVVEISSVGSVEVENVQGPFICGTINVAAEGTYNFTYVEMQMDASLARASGSAQKAEVVSIDRAECELHWDMDDAKYTYAVANGA